MTPDAQRVQNDGRLIRAAKESHVGRLAVHHKRNRSLGDAPRHQYIAFADTETGECGERRLNHSEGEAEKFYRGLQPRAASVRVGMEATGYSRWFERLLAELGIELWIGDAAEIKTRRVRKQKTDTNDARLLLKLLGRYLPPDLGS